MRLNKGEGVMFQPGMVGPSTIDLTHDAEYGVPRLLVYPMAANSRAISQRASAFRLPA